MSASPSDQTRSGWMARPVLQIDVDLGRRGPEDHVVIGQDIQALPPVLPDDDPRACLFVLSDAVAPFVPARFAGDDVDHRGRDGPGDELEGPIDVLELLVLPGQSLVVRLFTPDPGRRARRHGGGGGRGAGKRRPGHLGRDERAATIQGHAQEHPESQGRQQHERCASGAISTGLRSEARDERRRDRLRGVIHAHGGPVRVWTSTNIRSVTPPSQRKAGLELSPFALIRGAVRMGGPSPDDAAAFGRPGAKKNRRTGPAVSSNAHVGRWWLIVPIRSGPSRNHSG